MTYELIYSEQRKIIWVLILVPISLSGVFIASILGIDRVPDWYVIVGSVSLVAISTLTVLLVIKKWMSIKTSVTVTEDYFQYSMERRSPLYRHREVRVSWEQVNNFSADSVGTATYAAIKLAKPAVRFSLSPLSTKQKDIDDFNRFVNDTDERIATYNEHAAAKHLHTITHKSIFESTGARIGAVVFLLLLLFFTYAFSNGMNNSGYNWIRLGWLWLASSPYLIVVFGSWKKNKQTNGV